MADQWNDGIPALANQILADIPDIEETLAWFQLLLQMSVGWKSDTIASVGPHNHRALFSYSDDDTITIGAGSYFHDGTTRQIVFWDAAITFDLGSGGSNAASDDLGASEWHYIYLDDSAIVTQADSELDADCFLNDTTAPSWSAAKHGWYNGSDRCIFAVLTDSSSHILEFYHDSNLVIFGDQIEDVSNQAQPDAFTDIDSALSIPSFVRKAKINFSHIYSSVGSEVVYWRVNGSSATTGKVIAYGHGTNTTEFIVDVIIDSNLLFEIKGNSGNNYSVRTHGWYFPIGM